MSVNGFPMSEYAHRVSYHLRTTFRLHRRQAEWVCFRMWGIIEFNYRRKDDKSMAEYIYTQWTLKLNREYDSL